ncbi:MAG: M23 family metallopeptidase, partial [Microbacterium gubbeenense]
MSLVSTPLSDESVPSQPIAAAAGADLAAHGDEEHGHGGVTEEDSQASASELAHSVYAAATADDLESIRSDAFKKLVADARAKGLPIDPKWLSDGTYNLGSLKELAWPIDNYFISDHFGTRGGNHMGIDLAAGAGEPIGAAAPGVVIASSDTYFGYGVAVVIQHVDGYQSVYGHMTYGSRTVAVGDWVETGDHLGGVGNTGHSFGNHLHFELRKNGTPIDPYPLLTGGSASPITIVPGLPVPPEPPATTEPQPAGTPSETPTPSTEPTTSPSPSKSPDPTTSPNPTKSPSPTTEPTPTTSPKPTTPPTTPTPTTEPTAPPTPEPTEPAPTEPAPTEPAPTEP